MASTLRIGALVALLGALAPVGPAAASAALVVAVQGAVAPAVEAFTEAEAGARYDLSGGGEIILMHYAACEETHLRGGVVTVGALGVATTGERVASDPVECPRKVALAEKADAIAAVVLRGGEDQVVLNVRPVFVALGAGIERIDVGRDGAGLASMPVAGRLIRWPADAPALEPGAGYTLTIVANGRPNVLPAGVAGDAGVTVIQP